MKPAGVNCRKEVRVKNRFFTQQVCDCALLTQTLLYAQKAAQKRGIYENKGSQDVWYYGCKA